MPPKKNKGTKIDLSTLGVSAMPGLPGVAALPKGPQARADDDEGRFRRAFPGDDRGGGKGDRGGMSGGGGGGMSGGGGGDYGRSDGDSAWGRSGGGGGDRGGGGGGFGGDRGGDRGGGGGFGGDRGGGMGGGGERPRLNLAARGTSGMGGAPAPPSGGLGGRFSGMSASGGSAPPAAPSGGGRFGFVDSDRAADGGGRFGNGGGSGGSAAPINYSAAAQQPGVFTGGRLPGSEVGGTAAQVVLAKVAEEAKDKAKAQEKHERNAAKKAAKDAEEAAKAAEKDAKKAAKKAAKEQAAKDAEGAASLLASGLKGEALAFKASALGDGMPSARAVAACAVASLAEPTSTEWCSEGEFGACLKALCSGKASTDKAAGVLVACQLHYAKLGFPKAPPLTKEAGARKPPLFEKLLFKLYEAEVVEEVSVNAWRYADDDDKSDEAVGKTDALFNVSEFLKWLDEPPAEDESEEEEVIEVVNVALKSK